MGSHAPESRGPGFLELVYDFHISEEWNIYGYADMSSGATLPDEFSLSKF